MKVRNIFLICNALCVLLILLCFVKVKKISGISMEPSLSGGDKILVFQAAYGIKSPFSNKYFVRWAMPSIGDIVMFKMHGRYVIKRCCGTEGTLLLFNITEKDNGSNSYSMRVNGKNFKLTPQEFRNLGGMTERKEFSIPKNTLLLLGDNQAASEDSKHYGFVSVDSICGKVFRKF